MLRRQSGSITPSSDESTKNVVIAGSGFVEGAGVKFGGEAGQVNSISDTTIAVLAPDSTVAGPVDVEVTNVDGQKATLTNGFAYTVGGAQALV